MMEPVEPVALVTDCAETVRAVPNMASAVKALCIALASMRKVTLPWRRSRFYSALRCQMILCRSLVSVAESQKLTPGLIANRNALTIRNVRMVKSVGEFS